MHNSLKSELEMLSAPASPDSELSTPFLFSKALRLVSQVDSTCYYKYDPKNRYAVFIFFYKSLNVGLKGYQK